MGSQVLDASTLRGRFYHGPDRLRCDAIAPGLAQPTYSPEDRPTVDASRCDPLIDGAFRPHGNRNGTNVLSFTNQVSNHAMLLTDLEVFRSESNHFGSSESASDEQRQNRPITFASEATWRRLEEQGSGLIDGQPVANPYTQTLCALDSTGSCGQVRAQKASIGGFIGETSHGG